MISSRSCVPSEPQTQLLSQSFVKARCSNCPVRLGAPTLDTPPDFDQAHRRGKRELPPFDVLPDAEWLLWSSRSPADSLPTPEVTERRPAPPTVLIEGAGDDDPPRRRSARIARPPSPIRTVPSFTGEGSPPRPTAARCLGMSGLEWPNSWILPISSRAPRHSWNPINFGTDRLHQTGCEWMIARGSSMTAPSQIMK
jgi:hypothetical protein